MMLSTFRANNRDRYWWAIAAFLLIQVAMGGGEK